MTTFPGRGDQPEPAAPLGGHRGMNGSPADGEAVPPVAPTPLRAVVVELERHAQAAGWDQPPALYALVDTAELIAAEPTLAGSLGISAEGLAPDSLTPVEQEPLGDRPLDETLAHIAWPDEVRGCALVHEVLVIPPQAEDDRPDDADPVVWAADHAERRDVRMVVGVLRDGSTAGALRVRPADGAGPGEVAYGDDLAPNLARALLATLE